MTERREHRVAVEERIGPLALFSPARRIGADSEYDKAVSDGLEDGRERR